MSLLWCRCKNVIIVPHYDIVLLVCKGFRRDAKQIFRALRPPEKAGRGRNKAKFLQMGNIHSNIFNEKDKKIHFLSTSKGTT